MNKKTLKKIAPVALASIMGLSTLGGMAWLTASKVDEHAHTITAGTFSFEIENGSDKGFKNLNALPLSDALGKQQQTTGDTELDTVLGNLTVTNNGTVKEAIRLAIANEGFKSEIPSELVNVYITDETGESPVVVYDGTLAAIEDKDAGFGTIAVLDAGASKTYTIRAYIDETAVNKDVYVTAEEAASLSKAEGASKEVSFKLELLSLQADGGISGDTTVHSAYTEEQWNIAVGNSSLTRTPVSPRP